ncbi:flagellar transcriptional regulator FlhC [Providencia sp.]|uniref:flagellar transcriptional regulator FlhC n=1 Tax=Providencia sp. TaxID=589 RepID=UPI000E99EF9E|nr:flagellar transcriptional regulator FlhC [Providencia sp.]MBP6079722.1 flagellar transcriptional regulator FlhC [Providencia sp.]HBO23956.1 flagellar transcriptional regulator FlhC [Providencia sp.]
MSTIAEKSIVKEANDIRLAMELISLGARLQMLESETQISRGRLVRLYKELRGCPPPKGMLPFSTDWFMTWEQNIHSSMFYNAYQFLLKSGYCQGVDAILKAYRLYLEQCAPAPGEEPLLALTRAWTLVRFVESGMLQRSDCRCCSGSFITYAHIPENSFTCSLCQPPSRAIKKRKLSEDLADITLYRQDGITKAVM